MERLADGLSVFTVQARIADKDGDFNEYFTEVTVYNVAPTIDAGDPVTIAEGDELSRSGFFTDPGDDTWEATVDYGDGAGPEPLTLNSDKTFTLSHVYADNGTYTVQVKITDDEGDFGTDEFVVTVTNRPPVVDAGPDRDVYEGDLVELAPAIFTDAGAADTHEALIEWGDGTVEAGVVDEAAGTISGSHVYADNGVYTVTVIVWDDDMAGPGESAVPDVDFVEDTFTVGLCDDLLVGQSGRDIMIGGRGSDRLVGNADDDILIAGWTLYDYDYQQRAEGILRRNHEDAISAIMEKWMLEVDSFERAALISDPSFAYRLRSGETVFDDLDADVLTGSAGVDWFFFDEDNDRATDLKDEVFTDDFEWIISE